jgi:predicted component of type VI protein secretion system
MSSLRLVREQGDALEVTKDGTTLGRGTGCDLVIDNGTVSTNHVTFRRDGDGWRLVDQGSTNGTYVDDRKVTEARLQHGQRLRFGAIKLTVELPGAERTPTPLPPEPGADVRAWAATQLGVASGATLEAVRERYRRLLADFQARLGHAPTAPLRRKYQQSLTDLRKAFDTLFPGQNP